MVRIFDGAMGTELFARGFRGPTHEATKACPDVVAAIHEAYARAGAEVISTNTFSLAFTPMEEGEKVALAKEAIALAKRTGRQIFLSLGPSMGERLSWVGEVVAGADGILLETETNLADFERDLDALSSLGVPLFGTMSIDESFSKEEVKALARLGETYDLAGLGFNCSSGPWSMKEALAHLRQETRRFLIAKPNAMGGDFVEGALALVGLGVDGIGGCCGTTPRDIAELQQGVKFL